MENPTVTLTQERYEKLQDTETRVNVIAEMIMNNEILRQEDILLYLGFGNLAEKYKDREKEKLRKVQQRNASIN